MFHIMIFICNFVYIILTDVCGLLTTHSSDTESCSSLEE